MDHLSDDLAAGSLWVPALFFLVVQQLQKELQGRIGIVFFPDGIELRLLRNILQFNEADTGQVLT